MIAIVGEIQRFVRTCGRAMRTNEHVLTPGLDEVAVFVENDHRVRPSIEDIHVVVCVSYYTCDLTPLVAIGNRLPIHGNFILKLATAQLYCGAHTALLFGSISLRIDIRLSAFDNRRPDYIIKTPWLE